MSSGDCTRYCRPKFIGYLNFYTSILVHMCPLVPTQAEARMAPSWLPAVSTPSKMTKIRPQDGVLNGIRGL